MPTWLIAIIIIAVVLVLYIWMTYNSLVKLNERVNEAWSDIDVQLKYRADLLPNVVETVKGYAKHEKGAIQAVSDARAKMMGAKTVESKAQAANEVTSALSRLMMVAEAYPELKANENFKELQSQLQDCEDKLQAARRFYNAGAKDLNTKVKLFPVNLFNGFGFKQRAYFEVENRDAVKDAPKVSFDE